MSDSPRPEHLPPGYDENDPYEGEDLETYPEWWRESIELFKQHNMRPYRPSKFSDGETVPSLVNELSEELDVEILFRAIDPDTADEWDVLVDHEPVGKVGRHRDSDGFTQYHIDSATFESLVRDAVEN